MKKIIHDKKLREFSSMEEAQVYLDKMYNFVEDVEDKKYIAHCTLVSHTPKYVH